jgi:hypothetical protein
MIFYVVTLKGTSHSVTSTANNNKKLMMMVMMMITKITTGYRQYTQNAS